MQHYFGLDKLVKLKAVITRSVATSAAIAVLASLASLFFELSSAQAGVFNTPRFVQPGRFAIGLEPELVLTNGAGFAANGRFTYGLTDLNNVTFIIGSGGGPRHFRVGGNATFDFFPDIENQPGIGVAAQLLYYRMASDVGQLEISAIPYIHKTFISGEKNEVEPYFAFPFGWGFADGNYSFQATAAVGGMFSNDPKFRYILEFGISVTHSETYFSGGVAYYY